MSKSRSRFRVGTKVGLWRNPDFAGLGTTAFVTPTVEYLVIAGGGGGSTDQPSNATAAAPGGGGVGGYSTGGAGNGTAYLGGGGGGAHATRTSGNGGTGFVAIRYPDVYTAASATTGSPTVTVAGGYRIYSWQGNGSIQWD